MHNHEETKNSGYIEVHPYIYMGLSKCCRPAFALVEGKKADINLQEIETNSELLLAGANFIASLVKQRIKVYINYENENSKGINLVAAYLIIKGLDVNKAISLLKKKIPEISLNSNMFNKFKEFLKKQEK